MKRYWVSLSVGIGIGISQVTTLCLAGGHSPADVAPQQIWVPSPAEQEAIDGIKNDILTSIRATFQKTGKAYRDAHAKQHGCVKAEFTVLGGLEEHDLNHGAFSTPGKTYRSWIRFSNGSGDPFQDDRIPGGRGMAIKLFGVEGAKFLDDEKFTQDFQMINYPVFFVKNAIDYVQFQKDPAAFFASSQHRAEAQVIGAMADPKIDPPMSPLESTYYSMTARQLGPVTRLHPIKFSAIPTPCAPGSSLPAPVRLTDSPNALRVAMRQTLSQRDACFYFRLQSQTNDTDMPVNNPVKLWDEKAAPFYNVARIVIPKQQFDGDPGDRQETFCEDLSISPWHTIAEHQPLGTIELTRKVVYQATSALRHELNQRPKEEPTGNEVFPSPQR
jgi:hypothetical protein